jgi:hypothetical protein
LGPSREELIEGERQDHANYDSPSYTYNRRGEDNPQDVRTLRSQGNTNAEFVGALRDGIRYDAIESNRG